MLKKCEKYYGGRCVDAESLEFATCEGDEAKCDFYPDKKEAAIQHEKTMSLIGDIVDRAVKAGDRWVSIYCGPNGPSVNVYPLFADNEDNENAKE